MNWKVIKKEADYKKAIKRTMEIFHATEGTAQADELALLFSPPVSSPEDTPKYKE